MRKIIVLGCLLFCGYSLADGAFGTYKGMTKEELEKKGVIIKFIKGNSLSEPSFDAPVRNKFIKQYRYGFDNDQKLCSIIGETKLQTNANKIEEKFKFFNNLLIKKYGNPITDNNKKDYKKWSNVSRDIEIISLYLTVISLDKASKDDFKNAPYRYSGLDEFDDAIDKTLENEKKDYNPKDNPFDSLAKDLLREKEVKKNFYKGAVKIVLEYRFKDCQSIPQDNQIDEKIFLENSKGL